MRRALTVVMTAAIAAAVLGGCGGKFTRQNYETILIGDPASQVQSKLGRPTSESGETWTYENELPYYRAEITFREGLVAEKHWFIEKASEPVQPEPPQPVPTD